MDLQLPEFIKKYSPVENGTQHEDVVSVAGRIANDMECSGCDMGYMDYYWDELFVVSV